MAPFYISIVRETSYNQNKYHKAYAKKKEINRTRDFNDEQRPTVSVARVKISLMIIQ